MDFLLIAQLLIIIGALIIGLLGLTHLLLTFASNKFEAFDANVTQAMKTTTPIITKNTTLWRAWIGFNASHSLGALLFTGVYLPLAVWHFPMLFQSLWFLILPLIISGAYLLLAYRYWFKAPLIGISIALLCFSGAFILITANSAY